jgi:hypothetical protein
MEMHKDSLTNQVGQNLSTNLHFGTLHLLQNG